MYNTRSCPCNQSKEQMLEDICDDMLPLQNYMGDNCDCGFYEEESKFPDNPQYGNSYVPNQLLKTTFMPDVGLKIGTIFPELVRPYMPRTINGRNRIFKKHE